MYHNFKLETKDGQILAGLSWTLDNPRFVICIIHGIGEHAARYDRMAQLLNSANIAVLSMDLRGHGESFGKRGHCAPRKAVHEDIDALINYAQAQYPNAGLILYGHSMGGNITLDYKKRGNFNDKPLAYIISAPWIKLVRAVPKPLFVMVRALSKIAPGFQINSNVPPDDLGHPASVGEYESNPLVHGKISALCTAEGFEIGEALAAGTWKDNGRTADKPMLLMHGAEDKVCDVKGSRMIAALEQCEYIEWEGLYHEIHNGGPDSTGSEVIEKMIQWIWELEA